MGLEQPKGISHVGCRVGIQMSKYKLEFTEVDKEHTFHGKVFEIEAESDDEALDLAHSVLIERDQMGMVILEGTILLSKERTIH
ncbi:hypothetical protein D3C76_28130 [compost metagenome]